MWIAYAAACLSPVLILFLRIQLLPFKPGDLPGMGLFLIPVLISAYIGGLGPGVLATFLGALLCDYFLITPVGSFRIQGRLLFIQWLALILVSLFVTALMEALHRSRNKAGLVRTEQTVILSSISDAVITTDAEGVIDFLNPEAERLTGWQRNDAVGEQIRNVFRICKQDTLEDLECPVETMIAHGQRTAPNKSMLLRTRDGRHIPVEDGISPIRATDGTLQGVVLIFKDATESRREENALREQMALRERLAQIASTAPGVILSYRLRPDGSSCFPYVSPSIQETYGLTPEELEFDGTAAFSAIHADDLAAVKESIAISARDMLPWHTEFRIINPRTGEIWVEGNTVPQREPDGSILWQGIVIDITERKRAENLVRENERQLRFVTDNMPAMIARIDAQYRYLFVNRRYEEWFGRKPDEMIGRTVPEVLGQERFAAIKNKLDRSLAGEKVVFEITASPQTKSVPGTPKIIHMNYVPEVSADGAVHGIFAFMMDITERKQAEAQLQEKDRLLHAAMQANHLVAWEVNLRTGELMETGPVQEMFFRKETGKSPSLETFLAGVHPDDLPVVQNRIHAALSGNEKYSVEFRTPEQPDGKFHWIEAAGDVEYDEHRRPAVFRGISRDVTKSRLAEAKASEQRERFRATFEQAAVGIAFISPEGKFLRVNNQLCKILGYSREEFLGTFFQSMTYAEDLASCEGMMSQLLQAKTESSTIEKRYLCKDGSLVWCKVTASLVRKPDGEPNYFISVVDDVSERKSAEVALRVSQVQLQTAIEIGGMGMWIVDLSSGKIWLDTTALRFWGLPEGPQRAFETEMLRDRVHPDDRELVQRAREALLSGENAKTSEFRIVRPDGSVVWLSCKARIERDEAGKMVRWVFVAMDITERKQTEEERMRTQKLEALGTLSGGIAHDFNNILLAITENARLAAQDFVPGHPVQESLHQIQKASERAKELVKQIIAFSRPSDREKANTLLIPVIQDAIQLARATTPSSIQLESYLPTNLPPVMGNATQIYQVVVNLITNAVHAIGSKPGKVEIRLSSEFLDAVSALTPPGLETGDFVKLSISDDGCGMDKATLDRLFDPFFTTKPQGQGTGLGLAVVHGIIKGHGGAIRVGSEPGKGSVFHVYLPVSKEAETQSAGMVTDPKPVDTSSRELSILFVDDEEMLVILAERAFIKLGYRMEGFTDPRAAIREFQNRPDDFNMVVTDLSMPKFSGFDLVEQVQAVRPGIPIVMTSGYVKPADEERAAQYGVKEIVLKPTSFDELGRILNRIVRESRALAAKE
jgi:PAS domain S-box-containing protein